MSEERESYGDEPKYQIGDLVEFECNGKKHFGNIIDNRHWKGNVRYNQIFTDDIDWLVLDRDIIRLNEKSDIHYGVSYVADKPAETPEHYKMAITPIEFIQKNGLNFCEGNIVKYVARHRRKNGKDDLLKARHYLDMLIEYEYPEVQDLDSGKLPTF